LEGLRFELEIKSEFNWKMKSCKIQRLEFVSDKTEGGDSKREVVCIRFGCPTKKMTLVRALHGRAAMAGVGAPWPVMGELAREGREGEGERERWAWLGEGEIIYEVVKDYFCKRKIYA
jgi:hypothetical protein